MKAENKILKSKVMGRINETKIWVFIKINKINKPLSRLTEKEKERESDRGQRKETNISNSTNY